MSESLQIDRYAVLSVVLGMEKDGGGWRRMEESGGEWRRMEKDG